MNKTKNLKKCFACRKTLERDEKGKLVCPDQECREKASKNRSEKKKSIAEEVFDKMRNQPKKPKRPANCCKKCGGYIRKNYSHGKNSRPRVSGHKPDCPNQRKALIQK